MGVIFNSNKSIVTDKLVWGVDAGNPRSYARPSNAGVGATHWKDISSSDYSESDIYGNFTKRKELYDHDCVLENSNIANKLFNDHGAASYMNGGENNPNGDPRSSTADRARVLLRGTSSADRNPDLTGIICANTPPITFLSWIYQPSGDASQTEAGIIQWRQSGTYYYTATRTGIGFDSSATYLHYSWNPGLGSQSDWSPTQEVNHTTNLTIPNNEWIQVATVITSTEGKTYLCRASGTSTDTNTTTHSTWRVYDEDGNDEYSWDPELYLNLMVWQKDYAGENEFRGYMAGAFIYHKALSADEIDQNFQVLKSRYID